MDALHLLAIVDPDGAEDWTAQAAALAMESPDPRTRRWLVSLHSNLGWYRLEASDPSAALESFIEASRWADLVGTDDQRTWAAEAITECAAVLESDAG